MHEQLAAYRRVRDALAERIERDLLLSSHRRVIPLRK